MGTQKKITAIKAVKTYNWIIAAPLIAFFSFFIFTAILAANELMPPWLALPMIFVIDLPLAIVLNFISIAKWRIWAYNSVADMHELHSMVGLLAQLGLEPDKTNYSISSKADKKKLAAIRLQLMMPYQFVDDKSIPEKSNIYYEGFFSAYQPKLVIDNRGIEMPKIGFTSWADIKDEDVVRIIHSKYQYIHFRFSHPKGEVDIEIEKLCINYLDLKHLLYIHRMRYTNNM